MKHVQVSAASFEPADLSVAVAWLRSHNAVVYPTDTLYGLAVDPTSADAVKTLFAIKGRAPDAALPLIASSIAQVEAVCGPLPDVAAHLAHAFWPGPLSLILDAPASIAAEVHAGTGSIAVRVPAHAVARALCDALGGLLTATSANRSGQRPVHVVDDLDDIKDDARVLVLDAGRTPGGSPSTIVDARGAALRLVRAGAIPWERVLESSQQ